MNTKPFKGANVFLSRSLVPPEVFDAVHDALKLNGAAVFLCSDPSRNSPNDFHVISDDHHLKFEELRAKGLNLIGPQCVISCAKERRALPKLGFVCCLAMDGVKVLASGFNTGERERIGKLVTGMSGSFESKASSDVSFVIVKSVLAGKYQWAASKNKHIVTINWLNQCWIEHRVVPVESYRVPPFLGLTICVTRVTRDERKEMMKLIIQNGGKYSADLSKLCTHLICEFLKVTNSKLLGRGGPFVLLQENGLINHLLEEVQSGSTSSASAYRNKLMVKSGQQRSLRNSQPASSSAVTDSSLHAAPSTGNTESDLDVTLSQNISYISSYDGSAALKKEETVPSDLPQNDKELEGCVADDSESDDLYLSDCKIYFVGFDASDTRKLVGMVRRGGGSRYMFCNERLTHIIVGAPSDVEKRELRGLAALGVIRIVKRNWLEDCDREKKEVPVTQKHIAYDILLPKDAQPLSFKASDSGLSSSMQGECLSNISNPPNDFISGAQNSGTKISREKIREDLVDDSRNGSLSVEVTKRVSESTKLSAANGKHTSPQKIHPSDNSQYEKSSEVFARKRFFVSDSSSKEKYDEVIQWINEGGGEVADADSSMNVDFVVEWHGASLSPSSYLESTRVSSQWVISCLKEGCLIDVQSHILYSPLPCQTPLPGFENMRFCVSQYSEKEKLLLRNLCIVLGAKCSYRWTRKITHLLCKFANGPKYDAACKYGMPRVKCEWLYECVRKNEVVAVDKFYPDEVPQNPEPGLCTVTQNPTQAARLISSNMSSQISGESQDLRKANIEPSRKRLRPLESTSESIPAKETSSVDELHLDVAAIENLLEQTSKIQDLKLPAGKSCEKNIFSADCPVISRDHTGSHSTLGPSTGWLQSSGKEKEELQNASGDRKRGIHDVFSETQTESQIVGYEEDLSGRQMIIDRIRSSMT